MDEVAGGDNEREGARDKERDSGCDDGRKKKEKKMEGEACDVKGSDAKC